MPAPIALFVYNRPWHTRQTVEALLKNHLSGESDLVVFSDGPKTRDDEVPIKEVRDYIGTINGFKSVRAIESEKNKGLAKSIIEGVTEVVTWAESVIVVEDDLVTSPSFLQFMNQALALYRDDKEVISIHGYIYPVQGDLPETFFVKGADCWGWATWQRGWQLFEQSGQKLLEELERRNLTKEFDFNGSYPYTRMLRNQIKGVNNSWAIRWYASAFLNDKLTLYPGKSFVRNIGNDGSGTHSLKSNNAVYNVSLEAGAVHVKKIECVENLEAKMVIARFHKRQQSLLNAVLRKLRSLI